MSRNRGPWPLWLAFVAVAPFYAFDNVVSSCRAQGDALAQANPSPTSPAVPLEQLRMAWNSEAAPEWPAAEVLASISELSYLPPVDADRKFRAMGFERVGSFRGDSLSGYVVSAKGVSVIAFRGTYEASEWLVNVGSLSYYTPHGDIHEGYYRAYRSLKPQILKLLNESRSRNIWITGHSLGGALSLVCAYDLITEEKVLPYGLMTFGQPMVVDRFLANYLDHLLVGRYVHFVNEQDIVPRLPPGFAHCGSLVWFTGGEIRRSPPKRRVDRPDLVRTQAHRHHLIEPLSAEEFAEFQKQLQSDEEAPRQSVSTAAYSREAPVWIRDHSMVNYLKRIQSISRPRELP